MKELIKLYLRLYKTGNNGDLIMFQGAEICLFMFYMFLALFLKKRNSFVFINIQIR